MNKKNNYKKYVFAIWASLFLTIASIVGVFVSASLGVFGLMPDFRQLENPDTKPCNTNNFIRQHSYW